MSIIHWGESTVDLNPDPPIVPAALVAHSRAIARRLRECDAVDRKVDSLEWTVHELTAHLAATAENYAKMAAGDQLVREPIAERQQVISRAIRERESTETALLADSIESNAAVLADTVRRRDPDDLVTYYGLPTPLWVVAGMCLSELVVHGDDLYRTVGGSAPADEAAEYQAFVTGAALTPFVLSEQGKKQQLTIGYQAKGRPPIIVHLEHGTTFVAHRPNRPVDVWFEGTARHLLLTAYRRTGRLGGLRTLRLKGRRPYLSFAANRAFENP
jgi:uncharacterized protein (TIGR03083 family)